MTSYVGFAEVKERCSIVDASRAPRIKDHGRTPATLGGVPSHGVTAARAIVAPLFHCFPS